MRALRGVREERGSVLITGLLLSIALIMVIGAAVDIGHAFIVRRELASIADDAALVGSQAIDQNALHNGTLQLNPSQARATGARRYRPSIRREHPGQRNPCHRKRPRAAPLSDDPAAPRRTGHPHRLRTSDRRTTKAMSTRVIPLAGLGASAFLLAGSGDGTLVVARIAVCGAALAAASVVDLAEHRIPNRLVLPAAIVCAGLSIAAGTSVGSLLTGTALVAMLALVSLAWPHALGMGDVKLALLVLAGLDGSAARALALGLVLAALAGMTVIARSGMSTGRRTLPLAPFITAGSLLALLT